MKNTVEISVRNAFNLTGVPDSVKLPGFADSDNPYIPSKNKNYVFRKEFLREVIAFLKTPDGDALFVTGPTGSGKTSGITEIAARLNWPVQQITAHNRMELADLVGHHALVSPSSGAAAVMKFMYGPLSVAMKEGHILLINELDLMDPAELAGLNDILEGRPLVIAQNGGEIIKPHPMFRVIVTGNSVGSGDMSGLYQGVLMQNLAAMDRYRFSVVDYADPEVEEDILKKEAPHIAESIREKMVRIASLVRKMFTGEDGEPGKISVTMSTRTLVRWAKLTMTFRGASNALEYALKQALLYRANPEEQEAILQIAKSVFGEVWQ